MAKKKLSEFIVENRDELIRRCRAKVNRRPAPPVTQAEIDHGVPLFLDQLVEELTNGPSQSRTIGASASQHGHELLFQGFTVSQVVHDYGDVCQSVTDLAVELSAPISVEDFRTLNRCLDDAIAAAVTAYSRQQAVNRRDDASDLRQLTEIAIAAFEILQLGGIGVGGSTGAVVHRSLLSIRDRIGQLPGDPAASRSTPARP